VVFADDFLFPECLAKMVEVAEGNPSVGIVSAYSLEGETVKWAGLPYHTTVIDGREVCRNIWLKNLFLWGSANSILYRADLVRSRTPFYNDGNIHADNEVCFVLLKESDLGFVHQVLTFTRQRIGSTTARSSEMCTHLASTLHDLVNHAPDYLTPAELRGALRQHLHLYYRELGKNLLLFRSAEFWGFHQRKFREAGMRFRRVRVVAGALEIIGLAAINIPSTIDKIKRRTTTYSERDTSVNAGPSSESIV
jgi:hypothetical protein